MLPDVLISKLRSKVRHEDLRLGFEDKLKLLLDWAGNDSEKCALCGVARTNDGDYVVDSKVLCRHFDIKERSLFKNFNLLEYDRSRIDKNPSVQLFRKRNKERQAAESMQRIVGQLNAMAGLNWDPAWVYLWDRFKLRSVDGTIVDFCSCANAKTNSFISPAVFVSYIFQSQTLSLPQFQALVEHFGPLEHMFDRMTNFCISVVARGWRFGSGERSVELKPQGLFLFTHQKSVELQNNFREPGYWFTDATGQKLDIESFFEKHFPADLPSESNLIHFVETQNLELPPSDSED